MGKQRKARLARQVAAVVQRMAFHPDDLASIGAEYTKSFSKYLMKTHTYAELNKLLEENKEK